MTIKDLATEWAALNRRVGGNQEVGEGVFAELLAAYSGPKRFYHSAEHLRNLLEITEKYADRLREPDVVRAAVWFHDAVYEAFRSDNEEGSAELLRKAGAELGWPPDFCAKAAGYVLATKNHEAPDSEPDLLFLLDADLSVLAAETAVYERYSADVRKEYASVPGIFYKAGRKKVLRKFLEKDRIFKFFSDDSESRARANIERELSGL